MRARLPFSNWTPRTTYAVARFLLSGEFINSREWLPSVWFLLPALSEWIIALLENNPKHPRQKQNGFHCRRVSGRTKHSGLEGTDGRAQSTRRSPGSYQLPRYLNVLSAPGSRLTVLHRFVGSWIDGIESPLSLDMVHRHRFYLVLKQNTWCPMRGAKQFCGPVQSSPAISLLSLDTTVFLWDGGLATPRISSLLFRMQQPGFPLHMSSH